MLTCLRLTNRQVLAEKNGHDTFVFAQDTFGSIFYGIKFAVSPSLRCMLLC